MRAWIFLLLSVLSLGAAQDTIKPLFEASSVAEYDRWLWQHRKEYPGFRPVRALVGVERSGSGWLIPTATCLTDSGTILKRFVYPDSWDLNADIMQVSRIDVNEQAGGFAVDRRGCTSGSTAYDRLGRKLFESHRAVFPRFNLWFREGESPDSTQVLNDEGKVIGMLPLVPVWTATGSGDTLIAAVSRSGTIVFDRGARIRYRDSMFGTVPRVAAISPDGRRIAVVTRDSVGLHDMVTGRGKTLGLSPGTATRLRTNQVVWSDDSRRFAVYRADWDVVDTALLWTFTIDGKGAATPRRLETNCGERPFWAGDTVLLLAAPYFTDRHWSGKGPTPGPCRVTAVSPSSDVQVWFVKGAFRWYRDWHQQGRSFAYVDGSGDHVAVFEVPLQ